MASKTPARSGQQAEPAAPRAEAQQAQPPSFEGHGPFPLSAALLVAFALIGIGISIYLTISHYTNAPLACSANGTINCGLVTHSAYSVIGTTNIPITVPGLGWFIVAFGFAGAALVGWIRAMELPAWVTHLHLLWSVAGLIFVLYLIYAEFVLLSHICEWCSGVHALVILTFITVLVRWRAMMTERYQAA